MSELADAVRAAAAALSADEYVLEHHLQEAALVLEELGGIEPLDPDAEPRTVVETETVWAEEPSPCWRLLADPNGARSLMPELRVVADLHDQLMTWVRCELTTEQLQVRVAHAYHDLGREDA
jgi:hypothetical protein